MCMGRTLFPMNKHSPIGALEQPSPRQTAEAVVPTLRNTFTFRTTLCEACDDGYMLDDAGLTAGRCECVNGETDAACVDCLNVLPLNDEGLCVRCNDSATLPVAAFDAKYLAAGWNRVEL